MNPINTPTLKETRKHGRHLRVPVLPGEEQTIKAMAASCGLSVATYLRNVGLGYEVRSVLDHQLIHELAKINADQGRLGGLLKLWLTNDEKLQSHEPEQLRVNILGLLDRLRETQAAMLETVKKL